MLLLGGCCFRPETSKDGLKLFEIETVLSLEMRKPKKKADPSTITVVSTPVIIYSLWQYKTYTDFEFVRGLGPL